MHRLLVLVGTVGALAAVEIQPVVIDTTTVNVVPGSFVFAGAPLPVAGPSVSTLLEMLYWPINTPRHGIRVPSNKTQVIARTNGNGEPVGTAGGDIFAYKNATWQFTVPFVIADEGYAANFQPRMFTPKYISGSVKLYYSAAEIEEGDPAGEYVVGRFIDVADPLAITQIGEWSFQNNPANSYNVQIRENGILVGRTNGGVSVAGDIGMVERVAVIEARVAVVDAGNGTCENVYEEVPFVLTKVNDKSGIGPYRLLTPRGDTGSVKLMDYINLDELDALLPVGDI